MGLRKGEEWGIQASGPADLEVRGSDADLASAVAAGSDPLVSFTPSPESDLARAVGRPFGEGHRALPLDVLRLAGGGVAVNGVVVGVAPDRLRWWHRRRPMEVEVDGRPAFSARATTMLVLVGQYLRGTDVNPRSHPGDGVAEVQIYMLPPGARAAMRARLRSGSHLPHPAIQTQRGRRVAIHLGRPNPLEVDGRPAGRAARVEIEIVPGAYRLLV